MLRARDFLTEMIGYPPVSVRVRRVLAKDLGSSAATARADDGGFTKKIVSFIFITRRVKRTLLGHNTRHGKPEIKKPPKTEARLVWF